MDETLKWHRHTACTAFAGTKNVASGRLDEVAGDVTSGLESGEYTDVLIFDDRTSQVIEVEFRGLREQILNRLPDAPADQPSQDEAGLSKGRGRPKLGVIPKEVTLLPRHWDWLSSQPGGASVALRKLVEEASRANEGRDKQRETTEATYKFMHAMAGSEVGFEEASRALFAGNRVRFEEMVAPWPVDVRDHVRRLAAGAFAA